MIAARRALARIWPATLILLGSCTNAAGESEDANIDELPRFTVREELRIGDAHDPDVGFTRIAAVAVDADGNTYVAESGENHVRVYDPASCRNDSRDGLRARDCHRAQRMRAAMR